MGDEDIEMLDPAIVRPDEPAHDEHPDSCDDGDAAMDDQDNSGEGEGDDNGDEEAGLPVGVARGFGGLDESAAMAIFGDYRQFGSYMVSLSSRLKTMLNNIKSTASPTTRLVTLQELSELLSISTEDTLAGSFQVEQFVRELVKVLGGRGVDEDEDDDGGDDVEEHDEDAALAAALALSGGGTYQGDENLEAQMLACRCLANLMEALPGVAHSVVYHGAIPVLCSKLIEISFIDLAEQTLSVSPSAMLLLSILNICFRHSRKYLKSFQALLYGKMVYQRYSTTSTSSLLRCRELHCKQPRTAAEIFRQITSR